jgi:hypothetical protein
MLVDSDTISDYKEVYCDTLGVIRDLISGGLSDKVSGVVSTSILMGGPTAPQICDFASVVDATPTGITQERTAESKKGQGIPFILIVFGFVGLASGLIVAVVMRLCRRRRNHARDMDDASGDISESFLKSADSGESQSLAAVMEQDADPSPNQSDGTSSSLILTALMRLRMSREKNNLRDVENGAGDDESGEPREDRSPRGIMPNGSYSSDPYLSSPSSAARSPKYVG